MLSRTLKVKDKCIEIPGLEQFKGKFVEITVREKKDIDKKKKLKKFFALCGKLELDQDEVDNLRNQSMI